MVSGTKANLQQIADVLLARHAAYDDPPGVKMPEAGQFLRDVLALLLPQFAGENERDAKGIEKKLSEVRAKLIDLLSRLWDRDKNECEQLADAFLEELPEIAEAIRLDAEAAMDGDPAANSLSEIIATYPGTFAIAAYRIAHRFYIRDIPLLPRLIGEYAHMESGVDINPGAKIGASFFVDHGTGVVVGETAVIGDHVKLYQGVTLGALKVDRMDKNSKRHPTIEDHVVIYANATILGGETVVGHDSIIGGNVFLTHSILPYSRVMYKSSDSAESGLNWNI
jgi:serine O-acetyltransferase